ncbi:hypothetical protein Tco_0900911 [Tanacetum coccineum]
MIRVKQNSKQNHKPKPYESKACIYANADIYHRAETRKRRGRPKKLAKQTQNDENEVAKSKNDVGTRADANCADQE